MAAGSGVGARPAAAGAGSASEPLPTASRLSADALRLQLARLRKGLGATRDPSKEAIFRILERVQRTESAVDAVAKGVESWKEFPAPLPAGADKESASASASASAGDSEPLAAEPAGGRWLVPEALQEAAVEFLLTLEVP